MGLRLLARPMKILPNPTAAWAMARFRSSSNACSHSAMPSAARLVNISTSPKNKWPGAWSGTEDKALVNFASAAAKAAVGSATKDSAPSVTFARADPMSASILLGSANSARSKKLRACATLSGVRPC